MPQPYVITKRSVKSGMRYTGMYYDITGKPRTAGTYGDKAQALTEAKKRQSGEVPSGEMTLAQKQKITFEELWPRFQREHAVEATTMQTYLSTWRAWGKEYFGHLPVATVTKIEARNIFVFLRDERGTSVPQRRRIRAVISAMITFAVELGFRDDNPVHGIKVGKKERHVVKVLTEELWWQMYETLPEGTCQLFAEFIVSTGVRFCEAISFTVGDLDYRSQMLSVRHSTVEITQELADIKNGGNRFVTRDYTKNGTTRRFKISKSLTEKIQQHVEKHDIQPGELWFPNRLFAGEYSRATREKLSPEEMAAARRETFVDAGGRVYNHATVRGYNKGGCREPCCQQAISEYKAERARIRAANEGRTYKRRVVRNSPKDYVSATVWSRIWVTARRILGIDVTPYQLRHTNASWLLAYGVPLNKVQQRLGHNDLTSTTKYVWILSEEDGEAADATEVLMGYASKKPEQSQPDQLAVLMAQMQAMQDQMSAILDPALQRRMAAEKVIPLDSRRGLAEEIVETVA